MITNAHLCAQGFKAEGEAMLSVCVFFAKASVTLLFFLFSISTPFPVQVSPFSLSLASQRGFPRWQSKLESKRPLLMRELALRLL